MLDRQHHRREALGRLCVADAMLERAIIDLRTCGLPILAEDADGLRVEVRRLIKMLEAGQ
jgi:hypothetical protein